jgi:hypothetical protein
MDILGCVGGDVNAEALYGNAGTSIVDLDTFPNVPIPLFNTEPIN